MALYTTICVEGSIKSVSNFVVILALEVEEIEVSPESPTLKR